MTSISNSHHIFEEQKTNNDISSVKPEKKYIYHYNFDIKYEILNLVMKDFQLISQLIKLIKNYQISDIIYINGNNSYEIDSRFFFIYRCYIDFYIKVHNFEENGNSIKITYHVYKTKPICKNFFIIFSLIKNNKSAKLEIEIIPGEGIIIPEKILKLIYNEFDYNFLYLSLALKLKKEKFIFYNSAIIQNEFLLLSQIIQNTKLIQYLINGNLVNLTINNSKKENDINNNDKLNNNIILNNIYKIHLTKIKDCFPLNDVCFQVIHFNSQKDKLTINLKLLPTNKEKEEKINLLYNIISIKINKLTKNSSFIFIKFITDLEFEENKIASIKKSMNKFLKKIQKLSEKSKNIIKIE